MIATRKDSPMADSNWLDPAFEAVAIDDEGRACRDIPEAACREEAGNFFTHVGALSLSKSADALIDPKLVLSWLMTALGAPSAMVGLLVPIREAGALLPQLLTAGALRRVPQRKWAWSAGAFMQGLSALAIAGIAMSLSGVVAGSAVLIALAVLASARSVCSVCYKDVLGKTVGKSRRGAATGLAGSLAALVAIAFALVLSFAQVDRFIIVVFALSLAGLSWTSASVLFTQLKEVPGATEGGKTAIKEAFQNLSLLRTEPQLRRFILVRGLLTATALAPPFMVSLVSGLESLGFLVLASATAALISSYVWGRLSDRSSRRVLVIASAVSAIALTVTASLSALNWLNPVWALPGLLFVLMVAYQGVRLGRSTHLVDMTGEDNRAAFTALSNTAIGIILLLGAGFSLLAAISSATLVIAVMAAMCGISFFIAFGLDEVQGTSP